MVREGKVRVVQGRRDIPSRDARARALGLSNADADPRENASPEDKAPEDGNAAVAAPPKVERRRRWRTSSRSARDPRARAHPASGVVPVGVTREGSGKVRRGREVAKVAPRQP